MGELMGVLSEIRGWLMAIFFNLVAIEILVLVRYIDRR